MNEDSDLKVCEPEVKEEVEIPDQDDRYPGSFFKIPGMPMPGKTTWSIT